MKGGAGNGSQGGECNLCEGKGVKEGRPTDATWSEVLVLHLVARAGEVSTDR